MTDPAFDRALLEAAPVGLLVVDAVGTITFASATTEEMTGYGIGDVVGTSIFDYLVDEAVQGIAESVGYVTDHPDVLMGPVWVGFRHADGELRVLEILATNRYDDPHLEGLVVSVRDATTQYRLNEGLVSHSREEDRLVVLRLLCTALLGLPVRGRAAFVGVESGAPVVAVQLPPEVFGPAPDGSRPRPWQEALTSGEGAFPTTLEGYDDDLQAAARAAGLTTVWATPVPAPAASDDDFAACLVIGRIDPWEVTLNERINIDMVVRNAALVFERDFYIDRLSRAATTDTLTGLANRAHLFRGHDEAEAGDGALPDAVLYVDLDGFKAVNDELGHQAGDDVLCEVAERMRAVCRSGDELGRIGGDEFVVLLHEVPDPGVPLEVADRILETAATPITVTGPDGPQEVEVGVSVGVVRAAGSGAGSLDELVAAADGALYEAKRAGRNRWHLADEPD